MKPWESLKARDLMKSPVVAVETDISLSEAARVMSDNEVSGLLVLNYQGQAVGVVSLSDIASSLAGLERRPGEPGGFYRFGGLAMAEGGEGVREEWEEGEEEPLRETTVGEIMSPEIISVGPDTPVPEVAKLLWERRIHRVFVSGGGAPVGVISTMDVLGTLAGLPLAKTHA
jgi:CBS domain-containing protein